MNAQNADYALPEEGCRRHQRHLVGCKDCARSFVDRVRWLLEHPNQIGRDARPKLDPTPCGICGCAIGEGLMLLHMKRCRGAQIDGYGAAS